MTLRGFQGAFEFPFVRIKMQDALRALVIRNPGFAAQSLEHLPAVGSQFHDLFDVVARTSGRALAEELEHPEPLAQVGADAKEQGRIFPGKPFEDLERRAGIGPGLRVADGNLPSVGETGFSSGRGLPVDDRYFMAQAAEVVGRGNAE